MKRKVVIEKVTRPSRNSRTSQAKKKAAILSLTNGFINYQTTRKSGKKQPKEKLASPSANQLKAITSKQIKKKEKKSMKKISTGAKALLASGCFPNGGVKSSLATSHTVRAAAKKPPKFSFVVDGLLAGMGRPTQHGHMQFLCDNGFKYLITLTLNKPRAIAEYPGEGLEWVHIPIQDETPPSLEQIKTYVALIDKASAEKTCVATHCAWGRGRTGTMLACYLAKNGNLSLDKAIEEIRRLRPGSVDTDKQRQAIKEYVEYLKALH